MTVGAGYEGKLIDKIEEEETKKKVFYIFEEHEYEIWLRYKERYIRSLGTLGDFYGEGTGKKKAIAEAKEIVKRWGIEPDENIYVVVVDKKYNVKKKKLLDKKEHWYETQYERVSYASDKVETVCWNSKEA